MNRIKKQTYTKTINNTKQCRNCGIVRAINYFHKAGKTTAGNTVYKADCKYCRNIKVKNKLNDEYILIKGKLYRKPNEKRLKKNKSKREWYKKNREEVLNKCKEYYNNLSLEKKEEIKKRWRINYYLRKKNECT